MFTYHKKFNPDDIPQIEQGCKSGDLGCVECKMKCIGKINSFLEPIREKRKYYEQNINDVKEILIEGEKKAKSVAEETMGEVHKAMNLG